MSTGLATGSHTTLEIMSAPAVPAAMPADNASQASRARPSRRGGRGRGNRSRRQNQTSTGSNSNTPNTDGQGQEAPPQIQQSSGPEAVNGGGSGSGGGGGGGGGDAARRQRRGGGSGGGGRGRGQKPAGRGERPGRGAVRIGPGGRTFEGRLTRPAGTTEDAGDSAGQGRTVEETDVDQGLRADAPAFVPGQGPPKDNESKGKSKTKNNNPPPPRPAKVTTKSVAPDIGTRIHEDILHNLYECPICTSELGKRSRVWSCGLCWTVFHLSCVKKWSKNEGSAAQNAARQRQQETTGEVNIPRAWRCPGCNLAQEVFPSSYACWCEKEVDPRPLPGLPPHSCGQTCSRPRKGCPHPCDSICHAGPCAPCTAMGPTQDCFCGRNSSTKRCQDTDYENGWSCGEICGDLLPCGEHFCSRPCHEGLCGACDVKVESQCYCGSVQTEMLCSARDEEFDSELLRDGSVESWTGCFSCGESCSRPLDCGVHFCQKSCHPQDAQPAHCPRSPDVVLNCPCGKTPLKDIPGYTPRTSCEDPIPHCLSKCGKTMPCGHTCEKVCHTGSCGTCMRPTEITCRCGRNNMVTPCPDETAIQPQCPRICKAGLHCGRHSCNERCCSGEQKALERQALRRKMRSRLRPSDEDVEAEHICTRICGRTLKCGRHTCPEICHKGACNTCREAIFEEISCNCGRSILHPPLPCGTQPPPCSQPCERAKPCGHPQTHHNCHTDDERCPKCPFLTEKTCACGKKTLKNQPCWLADVRCGQVCGKLLKCGSHTCQKNCHRPGDCEDAGQQVCRQPCGKRRTLCGHPCTDACHAPSACPEKTPCLATVTVTCDCGRLRQNRRCNAAKAVVTSKGQGGVQQQPQRSSALTPLTCDEECSRLERNRSLASALGVDINPATTVSNATAGDTLPYSTETLSMYIELSSSAPLSTLQNYEHTLHSLAASTTTRSVRFQPAKPALRAFTHSLANDWGFVTESFDPEPHRHVFVLKPGSWTAPLHGISNASGAIGIGGMSVGECVKVRERQRLKEREAQRVAAIEAKAARDAAAAQQQSTENADGWAQVASSSRSRSNADSGSSTPVSYASARVGMKPLATSASIYSALAGDDAPAKKERLVLRSGVGSAKQLRQKPIQMPVADNWEEEEDKEEAEEAQAQAQVEAEARQDTQPTANSDNPVDSPESSPDVAAEMTEAETQAEAETGAPEVEAEPTTV